MKKEKHETCDGCEYFAECGCMLDDSCPECVEHHLWKPKLNKTIKPMTKDELKDKIIEILKRRVQNLIASDLISPFFWEDFADEIMKKEQQLAGSETLLIDETDNSPYEIIFNGRTYTRK